MMPGYQVYQRAHEFSQWMQKQAIQVSKNSNGKTEFGRLKLDIADCLPGERINDIAKQGPKTEYDFHAFFNYKRFMATYEFFAIGASLEAARQANLPISTAEKFAFEVLRESMAPNGQFPPFSQSALLKHLSKAGTARHGEFASLISSLPGSARTEFLNAFTEQLSLIGGLLRRDLIDVNHFRYRSKGMPELTQELNVTMHAASALIDVYSVLVEKASQAPSLALEGKLQPLPPNPFARGY